MKFKITNYQDFYAGVFFALSGIATVLVAMSYRVGTSARMGPGYFPVVLGGLLVLLGIIIAIKGVARAKEEVPMPPLSIRPVCIVLGAVVLFGFLLFKLGFIVSTLLLIGVSSMAYYQPRRKEIIISAVLLTAFCVAVFSYGLKLQIPLWPEMTGWN
jgi:hypothetical protein